MLPIKLWHTLSCRMHCNMKNCKSSIDETFIYFAPLPKYILLPVFQITPFGVGDDGYYWLQMSQIDSFLFVKEKKKKGKDYILISL